MPGVFPTALLTHAVKIFQRSTSYANGEPVESTVQIGSGPVACCISEVQSARGQNEQDGSIVQTATLTGTNPLLNNPMLQFEVVRGPMDAGTVLYPINGMAPHGLTAGVTRFFRHKVSTVVTG